MMLLAYAWLVASFDSTSVVVNCDSGGRIGAALSAAKPGDTVLVSGTCRESVNVSAEMVRIVLNGQMKTTIQHPGGETPPGPARHPVYIRGTGITITGFRIIGGDDGVHLSGPAHAVIDRNFITRTRHRGVHIDKGSVAQVINNTITDNGGVGINVTELSYARIGFFIPPDSVPRPNIIQNNGGDGVHVERNSSAWIVGNTIVGNGGSGVSIDRGSEADVVANTINGNRGDGILATRNSGVNLRSPGSPRRDGPNRTNPALKNHGAGIRCAIGGYVDGPLGGLSGVMGAKLFDATCVDRVTVR